MYLFFQIMDQNASFYDPWTMFMSEIEVHQ
jgi:hypothetical protein